jgi:hypothetical protein
MKTPYEIEKLTELLNPKLYGSQYAMLKERRRKRRKRRKRKRSR